MQFTGWLRAFAVVALAAALPGSVCARDIDWKALGRPADDKAASSRPLPPKRAASCAEFGPGFVRVESTGTCMRLGGSVSVGAGARR